MKKFLTGQVIATAAMIAIATGLMFNAASAEQSKSKPASDANGLVGYYADF
jgi:hypothetical protein